MSAAGRSHADVGADEADSPKEMSVSLSVPLLPCPAVLLHSEKTLGNDYRWYQASGHSMRNACYLDRQNRDGRMRIKGRLDPSYVLSTA